MTELAKWQNFYVIMGSSAGALIGLQFVVLSLIAARPRGANADGAHAFATPTIVHFGGVLCLSAILTAPWEGIAAAATLWGAGGILGVIYAIIVIRRMRRQIAYHPEFEDWLFHALLPLAAYVVLAFSAYAARSSYGSEALFAVGTAAVLLLFVGIHNAWDAVTYHVFASRQKD